MTHLIEFQQISKVYKMGEYEVHALSGVNFVLEAGEMVAIMGASGSGKSTAMNIMGCLDRRIERLFLRYSTLCQGFKAAVRL